MEKTKENNLTTRDKKQNIKELAKLFLFGFTTLLSYFKCRIHKKD